MNRQTPVVYDFLITNIVYGGTRGLQYLLGICDGVRPCVKQGLPKVSVSGVEDEDERTHEGEYVPQTHVTGSFVQWLQRSGYSSSSLVRVES